MINYLDHLKQILYWSSYTIIRVIKEAQVIESESNWEETWHNICENTRLDLNKCDILFIIIADPQLTKLV